MLICIYSASITHAQTPVTKVTKIDDQADFNLYIRKADSLNDAGKFEDAFQLYDAQIAPYLSGASKVSIPVLDWRFLMKRAAQAAGRSNHLTQAKTYGNMGYGTYGEKIKDKIEFLKSMGVRWYYTYRASHEGGTDALVIGDCSSNKTEYLFWMYNGKCYLQAFNECDTFKPVHYTDTELYKFYTEDADAIAREEIFHLGAGSSHCLTFGFTFSGKEGDLVKFFDINDITDYKRDTLPYIRLKENKLVEKYHHNMRTKLKQLNALNYALVERYWDFILSGPERAKIGRL